MAKVTDFGIAKAVSNSTITAFGTTIGSVHYFSPEHARGANTDAKSDIYSLGVVMYEMLTGRVPFDADTPVSVALMQVQDEPIEPKKLNPQIPISVNNIILKAMQKEPEDRYQNATDMLIDLSTALKRPNDDFVKLNKKFDTLQTQKINTLYDVDGKVKEADEEEYDEEDEEEYVKPKRKRKGLFGFLKEHVIISFVLIAIILFSVALGGTILFMNLTKSDDAQIPNLVKNSKGERLTEAQAINLYNETEFKKKNNLKIEYIEDETNNGEAVEPGQVLKQDPPYKNNYKIKVKEQITIYVRKAKEPKKLKMIDLTGKTKEEAEQMLKDLGYLGEVKYLEEPSESLKEGLIIKQTIQEGIEFNDNEEITLTVSTGSDKLDVPDTTGQASDAAKIALENAGFVVRVEYTEDTSKSDGIVLKQDIVGKNKAKEGETITLTVNRLPKLVPGTVTVNVKNLTKYEPKTDEDGNPIAPDAVKVRITVDGDTIYSNEKVSPANENLTATFSGKGNVVVKVYIGEGDGVLMGTQTLDLNRVTTAAF